MWQLKQEEIEAALDVMVGAGIIKVDVAGSFRNSNKETKLIVEFIQIFYTVDVLRSEKSIDFFQDDVELMDIGEYQPAYISRVSYGRKAYMLIESNASETEIKAAIEFKMKNKLGEAVGSLAKTAVSEIGGNILTKEETNTSEKENINEEADANDTNEEADIDNETNMDKVTEDVGNIAEELAGNFSGIPNLDINGQIDYDKIINEMSIYTSVKGVSGENSSKAMEGIDGFNEVIRKVEYKDTYYAIPITYTLKYLSDNSPVQVAKITEEGEVISKEAVLLKVRCNNMHDIIDDKVTVSTVSDYEFLSSDTIETNGEVLLLLKSGITSESKVMFTYENKTGTKEEYTEPYELNKYLDDNGLVMIDERYSKDRWAVKNYEHYFNVYVKQIPLYEMNVK